MVNYCSPSTWASVDLFSGFSLSLTCNVQFLELISFEISESLSIWNKDSSQMPLRNCTFKDTGDPHNKLLSEFPLLTQVCFPDSPILHDVTITFRRQEPLWELVHDAFPPECLKVANESSNALQQGNIRHSLSGWASPLHMVPKKAARDWRALLCTESKHIPETLFPIDILYHTYTIYRLPCKVPPSFQSWTWCMLIIRNP